MNSDFSTLDMNSVLNPAEFCIHQFVISKSSPTRAWAVALKFTMLKLQSDLISAVI